MINFFKGIYYKKDIVKKLIDHNKQKFISNKNFKNIIIFELSFLPNSIIAYSYFLKVLSDKYKAKPIGYLNISLSGYLNLLKIKLKQFLNIGFFNIYRSINVKNFLFIYPNKNTYNEVNEKYKKALNSIKTKKNLETFELDNILIGDLIYDSFLKKYKKPTVNLKSKIFQDFLHNIIANFIIWKNYIKKKKPKALLVSHTVYDLAIPLRICINKGIDVFQLNENSIYKISKQKPFAYQTAFESYPKIFNRFNSKQKRLAIEMAKQRTKLRFKGKVGIDMHYSKLSAYAKEYKKTFIKNSKKLKILIPTHCFFDSPHSYGYNIFPDFYEWIDFLGKISNKTDYDWYIKTHPDYLPGTIEIIRYFLKKYPKFNLLPSNLSHHQIIREGIDVALTVHGTIGFEYAYLGIPVINASKNNPHKAYKFNLHAENIKQYENILINLKKIVKINKSKYFDLNKDKILEFYFMHYLFYRESWLYEDFDKVVNFCGGRKNYNSIKFYEYWLKYYNQNENNMIIKDLNLFLKNNKSFYRKEIKVLSKIL